MKKLHYTLLNREEDVDTWHDFISDISGSYFDQTSFWANMRKLDGWNTQRLVLKNDNGLIAGSQIYIRRLPLIGIVGYISHGPCIRQHSAEYASEFLQGIRQFVKNERIKYMVINLPYFGDYMLPFLKKYGYRNTIRGLPPSGLMDSTLLIDLTKSIDELQKEMKKNTRYSVRSGIKKGVTVREGGREDIETFFNLMMETCRRRNSPPTHPHIDFFFRLWDSSVKKKWLRLHFAEFEGKPLCSILSFSIGDIFRIWKFGWSGEHTNLHPSSVLMWKLIELAKNEGYRYFDFVMLDTMVARAIKNKRPLTKKLKSRYFYGPTVFKLSFGGDITFLPGSYAYFSNPLMGILLRGMAVLLRQMWMIKFINKFWNKFTNR